MVERLIAQLAHVEIITPTPERSAAFFRNILGLEESGRAGQSVYFRGWGEFFHHSYVNHVERRVMNGDVSDRRFHLKRDSGKLG